MAHGDMRQFHRDHRSNGFLAGQAVNQALADKDGVAHSGGFDRVGEQDAGVDLIGECQVVGHDQVDDNLIQNFLFVSV